MENQDSRSSQQKVSNLDPLPESSDKYWDEAERHIAHWQTKEEVLAEVRETLKSHYFVRVSGHQAQCIHCDWGFQLDSGDKIVDGHLYNRKKELVI